jgi:hypothetical protein
MKSAWAAPVVKDDAAVIKACGKDVENSLASDAMTLAGPWGQTNGP